MNPDNVNGASDNLITRFLRLFQKRQARQERNARQVGSRNKRGAAEVKKRRRQIAQASRRDQRRLACGQHR